MNARNIQIFYETIVRLLHRGAQKNLEKMIEKSHAADLAQVIKMFDNDIDKRTLFNLASFSKKAEILKVLEAPTAVLLIEPLEYKEIVELFQQIPSNTVTDIVGLLPSDISEELLKLMEPEGSEKIEELLQYREDSAGGIMTTDFCALPEALTVQETIQKFQQEVDLDHIFYVYVVNAEGQLVGVLSLRKLLQTKPHTPISEIMIHDVIKVKTDTDQEEVAKIVARYNLLALPVVDENNKLMGIVTVDNIVDIIRKEATEDILKMGGAGDSEVMDKSSFRSARVRLPWLLVSLLGGLVAFKIMDSFHVTLQSFIALAFFVPLMMGVSGNVATQTATIVVSGLASGQIQISKIGWILWKELKVGLLLGTGYGLFLGVFANFYYEETTFKFLGLIVGGALTLSIVVAAIMGALLPIAFEKFKMDPTLSTGPVAIAVVDTLGILIYLCLAASLNGTI